jgi:peroxiredoxin
MRRLLQISFAFVCAFTSHAGDADADWKRVLALDAGPQARSSSSAEAQAAVMEHLTKQERVIREFIAGHAGDTREFEAKLRLARLLFMRGQIVGGKPAGEGARFLDEMEKTATPGQRTEIEFTRLAEAMRRLQKPTGPQRTELFADARRFQSAHPDDKRLGALLSEIALLFESEPKTMRTLLLEAQALTHDEDLKARIADDLRRVEMLGQPVALGFKPAGGRRVDIAEYRGKAVLLVFFAAWSEPSMDAVVELQRAAAALPKDRVQLLGVSLDTKPEKLGDFARTKKITWPVWCDGQGWESPMIRALGINALPTVWLIDGEGRLRSLNALEGTVGQVRELLGK